MMKLSVLLLGLVVTTSAYARDYYDDNKVGSNNSNNSVWNDRSSDSRSEPRTRYNSQYDSYPSVQSDSSFKGTSGAYQGGNQINNNGLIINRE
jgi:hypothetical protein